MAGHMVLQVWREMAECHAGEIHPQSEPMDCPDCNHESESVGERWFARYSAPGYLDQTGCVSSELGPIDAARECFEMYGDTERGSDDARELARLIRQCRASGFRK